MLALVYSVLPHSITVPSPHLPLFYYFLLLQVFPPHLLPTVLPQDLKQDLSQTVNGLEPEDAVAELNLEEAEAAASEDLFGTSREDDLAIIPAVITAVSVEAAVLVSVCSRVSAAGATSIYARLRL